MNPLQKRFSLIRGKFFERAIDCVTPELASIQPVGFNNTIHWHLGHTLFVTEKFLLDHPRAGNLPDIYVNFFAQGTSPADWTDAVPSYSVLIQQFKEQLDRLLAIPEERLNEKLEKPFKGFTTYSEMVNLALFHETYHMGQIHAMLRVINAAQK
ncbi:DinB family protein [Peribacillus butanolivorans]|uniref:DinB family protein n=1 Tax=Peribacillus butanolivorans TaxID=421767 RepID=UPI00364CEF83